MPRPRLNLATSPRPKLQPYKDDELQRLRCNNRDQAAAINGLKHALLEVRVEIMQLKENHMKQLKKFARLK